MASLAPSVGGRPSLAAVCPSPLALQAGGSSAGGPPPAGGTASKAPGEAAQEVSSRGGAE